ncbi:MAG: helix-turn-helix domain-containing protein [Rubrivivax sp.]|nr:helix-turn-helix domain-containing protein [Rubrivivax sp.]
MARPRQPPRRIPGYSLFGESAHLPDVLHCETIAARSALHDWELEPHRHARLHQLVFVEAGGGTAHLEGEVLPLTPLSLVNVPPGHVHGFRFAPGTAGYVATLAEEMRDEVLAQAAEARRQLGRALLLRADAQVAPLRATMRELWREFDGRAAARPLVLRGLAGVLLGLAARLAAAAEEAAAAAAQAPESRLLQRFESLVEAHYAQHWKVADYARALAVTPTHLSRVVRAASGAPASTLIQLRLVREARRHLVYTQAPITAVAYQLGFADPAHFTRVFGRIVGLSPREFRARAAAA